MEPLINAAAPSILIIVLLYRLSCLPRCVPSIWRVTRDPDGCGDHDRPQIFQLLLPEMKNADAALILLIVMSALAPIFAYSGNLITKETPSTRKNPT